MNSWKSSTLSACALAGGNVYCWGSNKEGQLGDGTTLTRNSAVQVNGLSDVTDIACNGWRMCALAAGSVSCWGIQASPNPGASSPVLVNLPGAATAVATGNDSTCAVVDGSVYCWGGNHAGQVGNGTLYEALTPFKVDFSNAP